MNDSIDKYLKFSKSNLNTIIENLEKNIEFLDNDLWSDYKEYKSSIKSIVDIYYNKYFLYNGNDFSKISKYINFNNKINRKLKTILLSIIEYYELNDNAIIIKEHEGSILYLTILIYLALVIFDKKESSIDSSKKIEKVINDIIDNFQKIRFRREKDLITLINNIKNIIKTNEKFYLNIDNLQNEESNNLYIKVNKKTNYYVVSYQYDIKELTNYESRDIKIVNELIDVNKLLTNIAYDLTYFDSFKLLKNGIDFNFLFPISKKEISNLEFINNIKIKNKTLNEYIKFLVNYEDIMNDYDFINLVRDNGFDVYIEVNYAEETNNYNMFMDIKNIVVPEEFLSLNEKYLEIWKDMGINFIIKNLGNRLTIDELIKRK